MATIALVPPTAEGKRKSVAFENSGFSDKDKNARLEEQMKLHHLQQLMKEFVNHKPEGVVIQEASTYFPPKVKERAPGMMNLEEFKTTVSRVLKTNEYDEYLEKLFLKLDSTCDGYVDWNEFCTYLLLLYRENDYMSTKREIPFLAEAKITHVIHNRQEVTTKMITVDNPTRYVSFSKEGVINIWHPHMSYPEKHVVMMDESTEQSNQKRRYKTWITDAVYMPNCNKIAIATTSRDIRFYDCSTNQYYLEFHLHAMTDVASCLDYWYDHKFPNSPSLLLVGVDSGAIHLLYFQRPVTRLFASQNKSESGVVRVPWNKVAINQDREDKDKDDMKKYVLYDKMYHEKPRVPPNAVRQVRYIPDKNSIISSTSSSNRSLVIANVTSYQNESKEFTDKVFKEYVFNIDKGVECFDFNKNLNLLVTGSLDHLVRLWNQYVPTKPMSILEGHAVGVIGVKIHEALEQVFSYSKDAVVKVWDIKEQSCLQTVGLKFPNSIHGRMPEHGEFPIHLQCSPQDALLVTCNDYIGMLKLGRSSQPTTTHTVTHDTQLCGAIYNPFFKQVVTGCDSSHVAVWELESGNKSIVFSNAHGNEEITCMVFDESWRRLITGARNGTIKVWNFQNGHNLHKLEPEEEAEVTGILPLVDMKMIIAVGWSRKITVYDDSDPDNTYIAPNSHWKGGQIHKDDILTLDHCHPHFMASAGYDGELCVWNLETEKIYLRLRQGQPSDISKAIEFLTSQTSNLSSNQSTQNGHLPRSRPNSRPNSRHRRGHRLPQGQSAPVDKVLFLKTRVPLRQSDGAQLISSEAGNIFWWSLYGTKQQIGYFYAPDDKDESVLSMCTDQDNDRLFTSDTQGNIKIWDIKNYCTKAEERRIKSPPPLLEQWKAHDSPIVSIEYILHETGEYLVTASTDKTARLWTIEGHYVGTFGQKKSWNLKNPMTWMHPRTPWTTNSSSNSDKSDNISDKSETESKKSINDNESFINTDLKKSKTLSKDAEADVNVDVIMKDRESIVNGDITEDPTDSSILAPNLKIRAQTFALGERSKTILGARVTQHLQNVKEARKERRKKFGEEIDFKSTMRYGKICSPFQAVQTKDINESCLPTNLPLSQQMLERGITAMTDDLLLQFDFSLGSMDTPTVDTEKKKLTKTNLPEKSQTSHGRRSVVRVTPPFKKNNTIL
ncbi:WD repeat-containing protein on Y chromosome-like isoform X4 [Mytilus californianus]|uniref:WD repeat-containing protein on Y chromosome-like isoform X4 n=1 Tax=Mytilus californianus TaxID=6549 RepID=UPI002247BAC0|nr:WD repeat-containing protein on Y chromosome-like isoform X4 [Mytilus californianus]